jgi:hypothetical protein
MDKTIISKEIALLIDLIKKDFQSLENNQQISKQETNSVLLKINELNKKAAVWEYLQSIPAIVPKPIEVKKPEPIVETKPVETVVTPPAPKLIVVETPPPSSVKTHEPVAPQSAIDIKKKIAFNERFEFTNELFKGNAAEYDSAIAQLSAVQSKQDALKIYADLKQKNNWPNDNEAAERLLEIIKNA